jgi:hypothetical protein
MTKRDKNWTTNQRKFMEWLATPEYERQPISQGKFAAQIGIDQQTLSRWKRIPGFWTEVNTLVRETLGDAYYEVVDALKREARKGNFQHQKLYFEMIGEYVQKQAVDVSGSLSITEVEVVRQVSKDGK